jgi:alpha-ketoglutarate-dependent taurine dioxygenase
VRAEENFWHSEKTDQHSPVRLYALSTPPSDPNANATPTAQRAKLAENHPGNSETRQPIAAADAEATEPANSIGIFVDGKPALFSPILLRDLCECTSCLDPSTKQKLFSTADIPSDIKTRAIAQDTSGVTLLWENDIPGYGDEHATTLEMDAVRSIRDSGAAPSADTPGYEPGKQLVWDAQQYRQLEDIDYEAYMQDEATLFRALQQLHTYGLLFLRNVPEDEKSVSTIAERIGPVKNTFYGYTWDVRSVPEAKNVAYTSQDLGFHMDLMYMHQPPHLQFLHCIRSSATGGASLFADSYKAAADLCKSDVDSFLELATVFASFHYNHPSSHLYHQSGPVIETNHLNTEFKGFMALSQAYRKEIRLRDSKAGRARDIVASFQGGESDIVEYIRNVAWSPPFQAPFRVSRLRERKTDNSPSLGLNQKITRWHSAAQKFSSLIHREAGIYERLMKPGECVIFTNRRVLHARRAFEVGDAGKERWLRGAYLDWDPYWSKMSVLGKKLGNGAES